MKTETLDIIKSIVRDEKNKQGFFDGRFRTRTIKNKKKEQEVVLSRKKISINNIKNL